jgi:hypothetical protein
MHHFWTRYIKPVIEITAPSRILEVGPGYGQNTKCLLEYCRISGAKLDVVDPTPVATLHEVLAKYHGEFSYHAARSLDAIPVLPLPELVLLNGDHNWFTVYNELQQLYSRAAASGEVPPIVLLSNVAWPYARRDSYDNPTRLDHPERHPYAYRGMLPDRTELTDTGYNGEYANALHEGGLRNGVLTAVEDYQASCGVETTLHLLPFFNGLGILVPNIRMTPALKTVIANFFSSEALLGTCEMLNRDAVITRAELAALKTILSNRTAALARLNEQLNEQYIKKNALRHTIARAKSWTRPMRSLVAGALRNFRGIS